MLGSSTSYRWTKATAFPVVPTPVDSLPRGGGSLLQGIVICNKTWAHHYTSKVYRQLWCGEGKGILHLSRPKFGSASKVSWPFYRISEVFLDINLQYERRSINSSHYCEPTIIANWQKYGTSQYEKSFLCMTVPDLIPHSKHIKTREFIQDSIGTPSWKSWLVTMWLSRVRSPERETWRT